jgi:hypothetical protein
MDADLLEFWDLQPRTEAKDGLATEKAAPWRRPARNHTELVSL